MHLQRYIILLLAAGFTLLNCAASKSDMTGKFTEQAVINSEADEADVLFILRHVRQAKGLDAIPKLENERQIVNDFDNMFFDALSEFSNIDRYATYTEFPSDVSKPERRAKRDSMIADHDFVLRININREFSFIKQFIGTIFSGASLTLIPIPYTTRYSTDVNVYGHDGKLVKSYHREASIKIWVQTFLLFVYPFHNEVVKKEKLYIEFLHDIFKQIETEKILTK